MILFDLPHLPHPPFSKHFMKFKSLATGAALGLTLSMSAPFATAALTNAGATLTNFQLHVTDLTPGDAQAAGITPGDSDSSNWAETSYFGAQSFPELRATSISLTEQGRHAWASTGAFGDLQAHAENSYIPSYDQSFNAKAQAWQSMVFWLLPQSAVSLSGHFDGYVHREAGVDGGYGIAKTYSGLRKWDSDIVVLASLFKDASLSNTVSDAAYSDDFLFEYANTSDAPCVSYGISTPTLKPVSSTPAPLLRCRSRRCMPCSAQG